MVSLFCFFCSVKFHKEKIICYICDNILILRGKCKSILEIVNVGNSSIAKRMGTMLLTLYPAMGYGRGLLLIYLLKVSYDLQS